MNIKNGWFEDSQFHEILKNLNECCEFKAYEALSILQITEEISKVFKQYQTIREKVLKKFGTENEKGVYNIKEDKLELFEKEMEDLLNVKIDIKISQKVKMPENLKISPQQLRYVKDIFGIVL